MTFNRQKYHAIVAAIVAVILVLPATPVLAETAPAAPAPVPSTANSTAPAVTDPAAVPTAPPAATQAPNLPDIVLKLPRDLSPWGMFMSADIVVKAVMAGQAKSWNEANVRAKGRDVGVAAMLRAADTELRMSADAHSASGIKERIASRLERLEAAAGRQMIRGTGILATIGATAPFVGLFGTVWGIMNSFIGISKSHTTNLAVVAPGIAEALLATALGLVAAIPAVVMYNMFSRWIAGYRALHADAAAEILRIVSRDLDRGAFEERPADRRRAIAAE